MAGVTYITLLYIILFFVLFFLFIKQKEQEQSKKNRTRPLYALSLGSLSFCFVLKYFLFLSFLLLLERESIKGFVG